MKSLIVGVARVDIEPSKQGERPVHGYTLYLISDAIGGRDICGQMAEKVFIRDDLFSAAMVPKPVPGIYINYEYNSRGRIAAVSGYEYEDGYTYDTTMKSKLTFLLE